MRKFLREREIQVVHPFDVPTDIFAVPVARISGVPAIISCQLSFRVHVHRRCTGARSSLTDPLADCIVVNSNAVGQHLIGSDEGIRAEKIEVCHNGVETTIFFPAPRRAASSDWPTRAW